MGDLDAVDVGAVAVGVVAPGGLNRAAFLHLHQAPGEVVAIGVGDGGGQGNRIKKLFKINASNTIIFL